VAIHHGVKTKPIVLMYENGKTRPVENILRKVEGE
jgi:hypothetical protein